MPSSDVINLLPSLRSGIELAYLSLLFAYAKKASGLFFTSLDKECYNRTQLYNMLSLANFCIWCKYCGHYDFSFVNIDDDMPCFFNWTFEKAWLFIQTDFLRLLSKVNLGVYFNIMFNSLMNVFQDKLTSFSWNYSFQSIALNFLFIAI